MNEASAETWSVKVASGDIKLHANWDTWNSIVRKFSSAIIRLLITRIGLLGGPYVISLHVNKAFITTKEILEGAIVQS